MFSKTTLTDDIVERIRKVKGVRSVEPLSMAQVSIENRAINLAAVDPATYRNYTPVESANLQEQWNRVAAGQLAIVKKLKGRIPAKNGVLKLGGSRDAPRVGVGAYAPQVPTVDAVVNAEVGEQLGHEAGQRAARGDVPVAGARVGAQAHREDRRRQGVGPAPRHRGPPRPGHLRATDRPCWWVRSAPRSASSTTPSSRAADIAPEPSWVRDHITTETVPILGSVTCNRLIFPQLRAALADIVELGLASEIHPGEYAGCYYPRFIAGTTQLSNHSFGLALDLNVPGNQRGTVGEMDPRVVAVFEEWGFTWGGRLALHRPDALRGERDRQPGLRRMVRDH